MVCTDYPQQKNSLLLAKKAISSIDNTNALVQQMDLFLQFLDRNWLVYPTKSRIFHSFLFQDGLFISCREIHEYLQDVQR